MKKVIVEKMVVEESEANYPAFAMMEKPQVFDTMEHAKEVIEDQIADMYVNTDCYVCKEVVRRTVGGKWTVTVYYENGFAEYQAVEMEM